MEATVYLGHLKTNRIEMGHPWVFRGEIGRVAGEYQPGDIVKVVNERGRFVGRGYINPNSEITVRLLTRTDEPIDEAFFRRRLEQCLEYRQRVVAADSNAYRLVYAEADGLPGFIVDKFADYLSIQVLSLGIDVRFSMLLGILRDLVQPAGIYLRNDVPVRRLEGLDEAKDFCGPEFDMPVQVSENGHPMLIDIAEGQKTGYFLDQRENRAAIAPYVKGARVLDCFSHTGGFAVHALAAGAAHVTLVDISREALEMAEKNLQLNGFTEDQYELYEANAFDFLRSQSDEGALYDVVMLDPPAFTKNKASIPAARRGYKEINLRGAKMTRRNGFLITSSCSFHMGREEFLDTITEATGDAHRLVRVVELRGQGRDHPVLLASPETQYLKFVVLQAM